MTKAEASQPEISQEDTRVFVAALHELHKRNPSRVAQGGFELLDIAECVCEDPHYVPNTYVGLALSVLGYNTAQSARLRRREVSFLARKGIASANIGVLVGDGLVEAHEIAWLSLGDGYGRHPLEDRKLYRLSAPPNPDAGTVDTVPIEATL